MAQDNCMNSMNISANCVPQSLFDHCRGIISQDDKLPPSHKLKLNVDVSVDEKNMRIEAEALYKALNWCSLVEFSIVMVGKSLLIKSLVKHYIKHNMPSVQGPITVVTGKNSRVQFVECPNDINGMIDAAKFTNLALLLLDRSYGFKMVPFSSFCSQVYMAKDNKTGETVALKKIRMDNEKEWFPFVAIREIKILKKFDHKNIVRLIVIVTSTSNEKDEQNSQEGGKFKGGIYMVFEYMDHDLIGLSDRPGLRFTIPQIKGRLRTRE
uniref:Protein kinase domain-containing protein n=1 Tax=Cannabis sativa TaxID=3483 RepID=A0A803PYN8_CANSA